MCSGYTVKITTDNDGNVISRWEFKDSDMPEMAKERDEWLKSNVLEEAETADEIASREAIEFAEALNAQDLKCHNLLDETDKKMVSDWPYPDDQPAWSEYRSSIREIIGCGEIRTIPEKPFGE